MRHRVGIFSWALAIMLMSTTSAWAQPFTFDLVANESTQIPGLEPTTFEGFHAPSLSGNHLSFDASHNDGGSFLSGVYTKTGTGNLMKFIDKNTVLPGSGANPASVQLPGDIASDGTVAYQLNNQTFTERGVYTGTAGGSITGLAELNTLIPLGGGAIFRNFSGGSSIDGNGNVVFYGNDTVIGIGGLILWNGTSLSMLIPDNSATGTGETFQGLSFGPIIRNGDVVFKAVTDAGQGIFKHTGGTNTKLVGESTNLPGSGSTFTTDSFLGFTPSFDGTNVAFIGAGTSGEKGIYLISGGTITTVADLTTTMPGTANNFESFRGVAIDGDQVVFWGVGPNDFTGLYLYTISTQSLVKVIDAGDQLDGLGIGTFSTALNIQHNSLSNGRLGFHVFFANSTDAVYVTDLGPSTPVAADTVKVTVGMALVAPGDTIRVPVLIENPTTGPDVGGLQMAVVTETPGEASFVGVEDTQGNAGFDVLVNEFSQGTVNFTLFSGDNSTIAGNANPVQIATLVYVVDANAPLGSTNELDIQGLLVGDEQGNAVPGKICIGSINVGIKGDIDGDGVVTILDVIKLARILVGTDPEPAAGTTAFKIADADNSGDLTVNDITAMVNIILNNPIPPVKTVSGPVAVTLDDAFTLSDGRTVVPVRLDGGSLVAGMQASFTFDPSTLSVGTIQLGDRADGIEVISHVEDGVLRVVVFRYSPDALLPTGSDPVFLIPVTAEGDGASLTLGDVQLSTPWAQSAQVVVGNTTAAVGTAVKSNGPSSFSLSGNAPNPFNPSTTISYEVPQTAHVQLVVYNLLGQEVVRLVNQVQASGRYEVIWDARNALGQSVSSGVYVYRLTSDTGHSEAKRMTLLK